jgi:type IV pilus biogenesis protein CpaD/CtpE
MKKILVGFFIGAVLTLIAAIDAAGQAPPIITGGHGNVSVKTNNWVIATDSTTDPDVPIPSTTVRAVLNEPTQMITTIPLLDRVLEGHKIVYCVAMPGSIAAAKMSVPTTLLQVKQGVPPVVIFTRSPPTPDELAYYAAKKPIYRIALACTAK